MGNVVARSAFVNQVDDNLCISCGDCIDQFQFEVRSLEATAHVGVLRCVGCGVMNCDMLRRGSGSYSLSIRGGFSPTGH